MGCACLNKNYVNENAKIVNPSNTNNSINSSLSSCIIVTSENISSSKFSISSKVNLSSVIKSNEGLIKETTISTNKNLKNKNDSIRTKSSRAGPILTLLESNYFKNSTTI